MSDAMSNVLTVPVPDPSATALDDAYAYAADAVKRLDKDRYLAGLYAPESHRRHRLWNSKGCDQRPPAGL